MRVNDRVFPQKSHVVGNNPLKKRARVLSMNFKQSPVRKLVADVLSPAVRTFIRILTVPPPTLDRAQIATGGCFSVKPERVAGSEHTSGEEQQAHDLRL